MDKYVSLETKRGSVNREFFKALKAGDLDTAQKLRIQRDAIDKELEQITKGKRK